MRSSREIPDEQQIFRPITREKKGSRSSDLQLEQLVIAMALNDIKEMKETVDDNYNTFKKEAQEIRFYLQNAKSESNALESNLNFSFKRLKHMFIFDDRPKQFAPAMKRAGSRSPKLDRILMKIWDFQAEEEERKREVPIIVDLLRKIRRELEDLGKKTKEKNR